MADNSIGGLLRLTWEMVCGPDGLIAFILFTLLSVVQVLLPRFWMEFLPDSSPSIMGGFLLAIGLGSTAALLIMHFFLSRQLLRDGGAVRPPYTAKWLILVFAYVIVLGTGAMLSGLLLLTDTVSVGFMAILQTLIVSCVDFLLLALLVRAALLASGEEEPRLSEVWHRLWSRDSALAGGYAIILLVFAVLPILLMMAPAGEFENLEVAVLAVEGIARAAGWTAQLVCAIAIGRCIARAGEDEAAVFA